MVIEIEGRGLTDAELAYEDTRRKVAQAREQQLAKAIAALREIEELADDAADVDDGTPNFAMRILVIAQAALLPSKGTER